MIDLQPGEELEDKPNAEEDELKLPAEILAELDWVGPFPDGPGDTMDWPNVEEGWGENGVEPIEKLEDEPGVADDEMGSDEDELEPRDDPALGVELTRPDDEGPASPTGSDGW